MTEQLASEEFANEGTKQMRIPHKGINPDWFMGTLFVIRDFDRVLANLSRVDDPRPTIMARQIINRILDDDIRYKLLDKFDEKMKAINESKDYPDSRDRWAHKISVSQDFVGEVNGYLDEFLALHKGQEIGEV